MKNMAGFVYILKDIRGRLYVGSTIDIRRRIKQHMTGHTQTTRNMSQPKLVFSQKYFSLQEAKTIEKKLKSLKRKDYLEEIIMDGVIKMSL